MALSSKLVYETLKSIDSASFTGSYQTLGAALGHPGVIVRLVNNSGVLITISTDGSTDMDVAPANSFWLYDVTSDSPSENDSIFIPKGTQYYVKGSASTGLVYLVVQYIQGS